MAWRRSHEIAHGVLSLITSDASQIHEEKLLSDMLEMYLAVKDIIQ